MLKVNYIQNWEGTPSWGSFEREICIRVKRMSWNIGLFDGGFYLIGNFYVPSERHQIKSNKKKRFLVQHKLNSFRIIYEENGQLLRTNCRCQQKLKKWYNTERWFIHFRTLTIHKTWIWCVIIDYYWQHKLRPLVAALEQTLVVRRSRRKRKHYDEELQQTESGFFNWI